MVWSMTLLLVHYKYIAYYINLKCFFCCRNQNNFLGGLGLHLVFFQGLSRYKYKDGLLPSIEYMGFACRGVHPTYSNRTCIHADTHG